MKDSLKEDIYYALDKSMIKVLLQEWFSCYND